MRALRRDIITIDRDGSRFVEFACAGSARTDNIHPGKKAVATVESVVRRRRATREEKERSRGNEEAFGVDEGGADRERCKGDEEKPDAERVDLTGVAVVEHVEDAKA